MTNLIPSPSATLIVVTTILCATARAADAQAERAAPPQFIVPSGTEPSPSTPPGYEIQPQRPLGQSEQNVDHRSATRPQAGNLPEVSPGITRGIPESPRAPLAAPTSTAPAEAPLPNATPYFGPPPAAAVTGQMMQTWTEGTSSVRLLRGTVILTNGQVTYEGRSAVVWETPLPDDRWLVEAFFDGHCDVLSQGQRVRQQNPFIAWQITTPLAIRNVRNTDEHDGSDEPLVIEAAKQRVMRSAEAMIGPIRPVEYVDSSSSASAAYPGQFEQAHKPLLTVQSPLPPVGLPPDLINPPGLSLPNLPAPPRIVIPPPLEAPSFNPGQFSTDQLFPSSFADRVTITPRNFEVPFILESRPVEGTTPPEQIITITRGVNVVLERPLEGNALDLTADAVVIWTDAAPMNNAGGSIDLGPDTPFQIYLMGNIVVRQGATTARATEAYFDRREGRGLLRNSEVRAFVPSLRGDMRVRAAEVRFNLLSDQLQSLGGSDIEVFANNAWVTASRFGKPTYRLQAGTLALQQRPAGQTFDPMTGTMRSMTQPWLVTTNNQFLVGELPVAASPYLAAPAEDFSIPIKRLTVSDDNVFGTQVLTRWDVPDLFGLSLPPNTEWTMDLDYLSDRGPRVGTDWRYEHDHELFGLPTHSFGDGFASYVYDNGLDNLGLGRRFLPLEQESRGAVIGRHRSILPNNFMLTTELGLISDFNFLEQYEELLWDSGKDAETLIELRQQVDNWSWSVLGRPQTNSFFNQTEWLPRLDGTILSQPLFVLDSINSSVNWSQHSMVGYGNLEPSTLPPNLGAPGAFGVAHDPLPYIADVGGAVAMTRHELTLPFDVGPVRVVPYALGELAYWQEALDGNDLARAYGSAGIRGSMMMTKVMPYVRSDIFGLSGLAHRMIFDFDYSISESTQNLDEVPQYNEFDDNAQERFRERLVDLTFGGALPITADPRGYALRTGAGRSVTSPFHELVDDQHVLRLGWRHRWQTRTGPPQQRRLRDWMTLDLEASFFPGADAFDAEDNFGESLGLLSAKYAWNVGERTSILADAIYDIFDLGQETWSVGVLTHRPGRGSMYLGYRQIGLGDLDSEILSFNYSYAMSPKWLSYYGFAYDLSENRSQGHTLGIAKIGRDFIWRVGVDYDESKNDFGVSLLVEPFIGRRDADDVDKLLRARVPVNPRGRQFR